MGYFGMKKENKTNAMRILDQAKISYTTKYYDCEEFIDGIHIADQLGQDYASSFKTLVTIGKTKNYYVLVLPIDKEVDLKKSARVVGEKSLEMLHVKDILAVTGYIRGGCTSIGMKKRFPTVIHESAQDFETIIVSGGALGTQIHLAPNDLQKVTSAKFADIIE